MLRLLDLFSGIGGFSLGMEATKRIKTIGFVEKDKFCQKVLQKNFKNIPIEEDIRNVTLEDINGWYELNEQRGAN